MMKRLAAVAAFAIAGVAAPVAAAPANGDTVTCASNLYDCLPTSNVISPAVEFLLDSGSGPELSADFTPSLLTISNVQSTNRMLTNIRLVFVDQTNPFSQATFYGSNNVSNFSQSNITLSGGRLTINFGNNGTATTFDGNGSVQIQLGPIAAAAVPEPASWTMLLAGFGAVGFAMRRRQKVVAQDYRIA